MKVKEIDIEVEKELITKFLEEFHLKLGYHPTVLSRHYSNVEEKPTVLTLKELRDSFSPFLPIQYGKKHNLNSKLRIRPLVDLRFIFVYLARKMGYKLYEIGKELNNRDHSTILYNLKAFRNQYETDESFRLLYHKVINHIKNKYESPVLDKLNQMECES